MLKCSGFLFLLLLFTKPVLSQDWRHVKNKKVFNYLKDAIKNKDQVYNLEVYDDDISMAQLKEIGKMKNLQFLGINGAGLDSLPDEIFNLPNLRTFSLTDNGFTSIPRGMGKLKTLEYLVMYKNQITAVPDWISEMTNLEELILTFNEIDTVSPQIGKLKKLRYLALAENLQYLPEEIGELEALEELHLTGNKLKALPYSIGKLSKLESLELGQNELISIPVSIRSLLHLKSFQLHQNKLQSLTNSISELELLTTLTLDENDLPDLTIDFSRMTNLKLFHLTGEKITTIPASLQYCTKLEQIEITKTSITEIPAWIQNLKDLNWLVLDENKIERVPSFLKNLKKLEVLRLTDNKIDTIPADIFLLPRLKVLAINDNPIRHIPSQIKLAKSLEHFPVFGTEISYAEYKTFRKQLPAKVEIPHDSPFAYEDDTKPCYTDITNLKSGNVFTKLPFDPYFTGGHSKWQEFIAENINKDKVFKSSAKTGIIDSVVVEFIVRREAGISNIKPIYFRNNEIKNEVIRVLKLSCPYWVPSNFSGRNINSWFRQSFIFKQTDEEFIVYALTPEQ